MRRFKKWLILKLGGFISQEVVEYRCVETETEELFAFAVQPQISTNFEKEDYEHFERKIKGNLVREIAEQLVDKGLIRFDRFKVDADEYGPRIHYEAKLRVYKRKGVIDDQEQKK
jgi:hypothetical protein